MKQFYLIEIKAEETTILWSGDKNPLRTEQAMVESVLRCEGHSGHGIFLE
jgi:hypothetical protein